MELTRVFLLNSRRERLLVDDQQLTYRTNSSPYSIWRLNDNMTRVDVRWQCGVSSKVSKASVASGNIWSGESHGKPGVMSKCRRAERVTFARTSSIVTTVLLCALLIDVSHGVPATSSPSPPLPLSLSSPLLPSSLLSQSISPSSSLYRLPTATSPVSYDLRFVPNLNGTESTFVGVTKITVLVFLPTNVITLNINDLKVTMVTVTDVVVTDVVHRVDCERLEIHVAGDLVPGRMYLVTIAYQGVIRDDKTGLYMASYVEDDKTKWVVCNDLEKHRDGERKALRGLKSRS